MANRVRPVLFALATMAGACASSLTLRGRFDHYGDVDRQPAGGQIVATAEDVKVYYGTAPDGFSLRENELKVEPGFEHRILGTARVLIKGGVCHSGDLGKADVLAELRALAWRNGGNAIIYAFSHVSAQPEGGERCREIAGKEDLGNGWVVVVSPGTAAPATEAGTTGAPAAP